MEKLLVDKKSGDNIKVKVKDVVIGHKEKVIISGPCAIENEDTMMKIGEGLKDAGVHILRGGAFKPRTSPYSFQGLQFEGIKILKSVGDKFNMPIVSEIMDARDLEKAYDYIDMIQIGSRNMYNYTLLKEVGKTKKPVLLKRGMSATLSEWMYAAEYILSEGNANVVLCERGIRTFESYTRNTLDINSVSVIKDKYRLPIIVDPSHATGFREYVKPMALASIVAGADGLIIESHIEPDKSVSDARQTVSIEEMRSIIHKVKKLTNIFDGN
ncbi:3-deoxy-7-phosphoheptulonate synthase [Clostridium niameyense]|uniref:3-deoxy-7-phosphoheptulonate synthase n=1 Tax=Clostridium niameyense TaxID=1622073 RepID=A0A6M0R9M5_9CLOT|nr:3-deoxy-7-phosphoheptulonate synthase [Clostridium niameyense]NEZ46360.1 3-deoxy-7-phosphoheptulonate synthase [Clostridium niameyense]